MPSNRLRRAGARDVDQQITRERILQEADPIGFLINVQLGKRFKCAREQNSKTKRWVFPTLDQRVKCAQLLADKVLPDLKAIEVTDESKGFTVIVQKGEEVKVITEDGKPIEAHDVYNRSELAKTVNDKV